MRLSTLRILLLVLAMVLQTVAGGAGLAHAAAAPPGTTLGVQCQHLSADERSAPDDRAGHRHNCLSCLLCGEPPPAWVSLASADVVDFDEYALIKAPTGAKQSSLRERPSRAHSARAPPFSRA